MLRETKLVLIKYARAYINKGFFEWEKISDEIRDKGLDYNYYESFFVFYRDGQPAGYDWINGNDNWKRLVELVKSGVKTNKIIDAL